MRAGGNGHGRLRVGLAFPRPARKGIAGTRRCGQRDRLVFNGERRGVFRGVLAAVQRIGHVIDHRRPRRRQRDVARHGLLVERPGLVPIRPAVKGITRFFGVLRAGRFLPVFHLQRGRFGAALRVKRDGKDVFFFLRRLLLPIGIRLTVGVRFVVGVRLAAAEQRAGSQRQADQRQHKYDKNGHDAVFHGVAP